MKTMHLEINLNFKQLEIKNTALEEKMQSTLVTNNTYVEFDALHGALYSLIQYHCK